jgi:hypothetical protein
MPIIPRILRDLAGTSLGLFQINGGRLNVNNSGRFRLENKSGILTNVNANNIELGDSSLDSGDSSLLRFDSSSRTIKRGIIDDVSFNPGYCAHVYDEFTTLLENARFQNRTNGAGSTIALVADTGGRPGIANFITGTTSTGRSATGLTGSVFTGYGRMIFNSSVLIPALSTGTDTFHVLAGFTSSFVLAPPTYSQGNYFYYSHAANDGVFSCVSVDAAGSTVVPSDVIVQPNTWYNLRVEINPLSTQVVYKINGQDVLSTSDRMNSRSINPTLQILKSNGVNSASFHVDYLQFIQYFSGSR